MVNGYLEELFDSCFKQSLNMVDETWDTASLLDIADYKNGLAMQKFRPNIGDKGLPVLKIRELGRESCGKDAERCRSDIDESVTVHDGDLVFSWSGTLLLRFWAGGDAGLNQHLFKVTSEVYPSWFYYAWTKHHLARFTMLAKDRAITMGHIKRSALEESEVLLPPKEKLTMQTKCMQPIIDQVIANKIEVRKLAALRDALLPKLMSGEIDVSKIDLTQLNSQFPKAWLSRCLPRCWDWICHPELAMRVVAPVFVGGVKRSNFIVASADALMDMGANLQHVVLGIHALLVGGVNGIHLCENRI